MLVYSVTLVLTGRLLASRCDDQHEHAIHACGHRRRWVSGSTDIRSSRFTIPTTSGALEWDRLQPTPVPAKRIWRCCLPAVHTDLFPGLMAKRMANSVPSVLLTFWVHAPTQTTLMVSPPLSDTGGSANGGAATETMQPASRL